MTTSRRSDDLSRAIARLQERVDLLERRKQGLPITWQSHTPVLTASVTNPVLGTGAVQQGAYLHDPRTDLVVYRFHIQFGSSGASGGSGEYRVSTPVPISTMSPATDIPGLGIILLYDWSVAGHKDIGVATRGASASTLTFKVEDASVFSNNPFIWTVDDRFGGTVVYQAG